MPELPEVETVVRDLRPLIVGRTIHAVEKSRKGLRRPWASGWNRRVIGTTVRAVDRRGKWIRIVLSTDAELVVHLGMTGQLTAIDETVPRENHTHLVWPLNGGRELRFRDIRRFGSVDLFDDAESCRSFLDARLGPEPWDMTVEAWVAAVRHARRNLKALLLDQTVIAGVGNIYADESCFAAGLRPRRTAASLTRQEAQALLTAVREVLERAIDRRGSTIRNYVGGSGLEGGFQDEFRVYGRKGQPCVTCGRAIERIVLAGRATHFCRHCQR